MHSIIGIFLFLFLSFLISPLVATHKPHHPLDPLTPSELNQVQTLIKKLHQTITFHYVGLDDPNKHQLLSWISHSRSSSFVGHRRAFVMARVDSETHEIIVDLSENSVVLDKIYRGSGYPMLNNEEQVIPSELPLKYAPFKASIAKRGFKLSEILCEAFTVGWYGAKHTKRVATIMCYYIDGIINFYMKGYFT